MKPMTSYAQNFEDVMLSRALSGVEAGFYIDVGAQDPIADSVTRAFYVRGWRGINIDPVKHWHQRLKEDRPHDINLRLAVGATQGEIRVHEVADSGLSTTSDDYAARHEESGFSVSSEMVEMTTLDAIMAEQRVREVHFLKIDVEGAEKDVLTGISLRDVRPWIILVESREPNSQVTTHDAWEHLLIEASYAFVYDDGLNRFYVANEHSELSAAFKLPPNVFDNFTSWSDPSAETALALCKEGARLTQARLEEVDADRASLTHSLATLRSDRDGLAKWAAELEVQTAHSKNQIESLLENAGRMEAEAAGLNARLAEVLETGAATSSALRGERDELAAKLEQIRLDREGLVKWVGQLQADSTSHAGRIEELLKQLARAEAARDALVDDFQAAVARSVEVGILEAGEERDRFQRLHMAEVARATEIEERLAHAEQENARLTALAERAFDEVASLREWFDLEYQGKLSQQAIVHQSALDVVNASLAAASIESATLRDEAGALRQRLSAADAAVAGANAREQDLSRLAESLQARLDQAQERVAAAARTIEGAVAREEGLTRIVAALQAQLDTILGSRSWRITSPLRAIARVVRGERAQPDHPLSLPPVAAGKGEAQPEDVALRVETPDGALREKHVASLERLSGLVRRKSK